MTTAGTTIKITPTYYVKTVGSSAEVFATEALLLASDRSNGTVAYATDTGRHFVRELNAWVRMAIGETSGSGWVYIEDLSVVGGTVTEKEYQDAGNTILQSATVSSGTFLVHLRTSFPKVKLNGVENELSRSIDGSHYAGSIEVTLTASGTVLAIVQTPEGVDGASDVVDVTLSTPPTLLSLQFSGGYPSGQTELKEGDTFEISGTTDKLADAVEIQDYGACIEGLETFTAGTSFTVTGTIADRGTTLQALAARVRARDAATGALGPSRDTNTGGGSIDGVNLVKLNNLHPTLSWGTPVYPGAQGALKDSESATVALTYSNANSAAFVSPTSELSITNPSTLEASKTVTRISGNYNVSTVNLRGTAIRTANAAETVAEVTVKIAHASAGVSVALPAARLRSGGNDGTVAQDHTITVTSDQELLEAPTLDAGVGGGTWQGVGFVGGPLAWTRALRVTDDDTKDTYDWSNLEATNLAGRVTTVITGSTEYVLGGFVARSLTFPAFSQEATLHVAVVDYAKLTAGVFTATNQTAVKMTTQGDHTNSANHFTVDSVGDNPTTLWWNDVSVAGSNSSGTAQITLVEETV